MQPTAPYTPAPRSPALVPFCKLADARRYVACSLDLAKEPTAREYWVAFFQRHIHTILKLGVESAIKQGENPGNAKRRAASCLAEYAPYFDAYVRNPDTFKNVTILSLDQWRDDFLRQHGFDDAFADLKNRENEKMLPLVAPVCRQIDALSGRLQLDAVILGVFAGNIFDMGAEATAAAFLGASPDFFTTRQTITPRPWLIDDYDGLVKRLIDEPPHRRAVYFIDNAGSDFLLGAVPMIRWLAMRGTQVVIAANERPTLNDMTTVDVRKWWPRILDAEPTLRSLPIEIVSTGTSEPLIDLSGVSQELNAAACDADLVILEGMGRGVESNLDVEMSCDCLNLAMIKDIDIAKRHGGKMFDVVCRFRQSTK